MVSDSTFILRGGNGTELEKGKKENEAPPNMDFEGKRDSINRLSGSVQDLVKESSTDEAAHNRSGRAIWSSHLTDIARC